MKIETIESIKNAYHKIRRFFLSPFVPELFMLEQSSARMAERLEQNQQILTRIFDDLDTNVRLIRELQQLEFQNHNNLNAIANYIIQSKLK